jgi:hypothetical protein
MKRKTAVKDFCKTKLKVGKTKAAPSNATNTDFSSKALFIPVQSVVKDRQGQLKSVRGLTLSDLLTQTRHYNAHTRKDALVGIKELLGKDSVTILGRINEIFDHCLKLMIDPEESVRSALFSLLKDVFSCGESVVCFGSFAEKIMTFVLASLAHLNENVRIAGLKYLELILHRKILTNVSIYQGRIFSSVLFILNGKKKGSNHLQSILLVIEALVGELAVRNPYGIIFEDASVAEKIVLHLPKDNLLLQDPEYNSKTTGASVGNQRFLSGMFCGYAVSAKSSAQPDTITCCAFIQKLIGLLMEMWIECSPELLNEKSIKIDQLKNLLFILNALKQCVKFLYFFRSPLLDEEEMAKGMQKRMLQHFPFGKDLTLGTGAGCSAEALMLFLQMNFEFIELSGLLFDKVVVGEREVISDYLESCLDGCRQLNKSVECIQKAMVFCYSAFVHFGEAGSKKRLCGALERFHRRQNRSSLVFAAVERFLGRMKILKRDFCIGQSLVGLFDE